MDNTKNLSVQGENTQEDIYSGVTSTESLAPESEIYSDAPADLSTEDTGPTVAVSGENRKDSLLFKLLFISVFIAFITVSAILYFQLRKNNASQAPVLTVTPIPSLSATSEPTIAPTDKPTPTVSKEKMIIDNIRNISSSDEIVSLEDDIKATDLKNLEFSD